MAPMPQLAVDFHPLAPIPIWRDNPHRPLSARIVGISAMVADHHLFSLRLLDDAAARALRHFPGQYLMLSVPGDSETPVSIASSPTRPEALELCVSREGRMAAALYRQWVGDLVGVRGPFGNGFPIKVLEGQDLLLVAEGLGMAPLRSLLGYALDRRERFGAITLMVGARTPAEMLFGDELAALAGRDDLACRLTVDRDPTGTWRHSVGNLPGLFDRATIDPARTFAAVCGPPAAYRAVLERLLALGFSRDRILVSLDRRMSCGIGRCGRCSIGCKYTCLHGPIFSARDTLDLPEMV
jgi:sulfhydrogenase subunit gamma (sulfur reductase)